MPLATSLLRLYAWLCMEALQTESLESWQSVCSTRVLLVLEIFSLLMWLTSTYFLSDRSVCVVKILKTFEKFSYKTGYKTGQSVQNTLNRNNESRTLVWKCDLWVEAELNGGAFTWYTWGSDFSSQHDWKLTFEMIEEGYFFKSWICSYLSFIYFETGSYYAAMMM